MSFRCGGCGNKFPNDLNPQHRPIRVVVAAHGRSYQIPFTIEHALGWEIDEERNLCTGCLKTYNPPTVTIGENLSQEPTHGTR